MSLKGRVVIASANQGKLKEFEQILGVMPVELVTQSSFGLQGAEEKGLSFIENAILKARYASAHSGLPAIADDSGISVDYLNGSPGIYSARYAGSDATDEQNLTKLLAALRGVAEAGRSARFHCVICYLRYADDPTPLMFEGIWEGRILTEPRGSNGFGYDPVFYVPERGCSAAELDSADKNRLSHRGQALQRCVDYFSQD